MSQNKPRFGGTERVYGQNETARLRQAHFCVVGIGGVGTWAAEALARSAIGKITLIDLDDICATNTNRQIHAMNDTVGQAKVDVMAQRIRNINPDCEVLCVEDFVTADNISALITPEIDYVIDAIDSIPAKAALISHCKRQKINVITTGGAGGQIDPSQITIADLSKTIQDPLAAKLRNQLRRFHNFSKNPKRRFAIDCVYSKEQLRYPQADGSIGFNKSSTASSRLDCSTGFGAAVVVTATFGMFAASRAISKYISKTS